ncbi:MAG TPA: family 78 glycoside hydrolase catalytic domain, partial [Acidimicrobiales bacterium]|nr:family 78 glycoside hydrolase catalytic domain [Acidimicrobiales bacterium]
MTVQPPWTLSRRALLKSGVMAATGAASGASVLSGCGGPTPRAVKRRPLPPPYVEVGGPPGRPNALAVDGLAAPIGLGLDDVQFAWGVGDTRRGAVQRAYRVVVSRPVLAGAGAGSSTTVWDSGRVASGDQAFVRYGGPRLAPDSTYAWTVQTWAQSGGPGPFSPSATFETGLGDGDWRASWIWRPAALQPSQYTYARKEVALTASPIVRGRAYVAAGQQYELSVNGNRVGKGHAHCYPDAQYYETLDVTAALMPGRPNAFALVYSWQGATKGHPAGHPGCIVQVSVLHADGTTELVTTDGTWRVRPGAWLPGTQRDLEGDNVDFTENIDGRAVPVGWDSAGFDDSAWAPATVLGPAGTKPWTHLVSVRTRVVEEPVAAVSLTTLPSGAVVADFGKVYAAVPTVSFKNGVAGRVVTMRAGYLLDEPGGPSFTGFPGQVSTEHGTQHTNMRYSYVQRGGAEVFHPFDYLAFRYLQIDDPGETLAPADVVALTRHAVVPDQNAGAFVSSEPQVDAVFELGRHSALYCAQEQFLDTPTREKGPWLYDGFNSSQTAMAAFGDQNMTRKSLEEFAASQARYWPSGAINKIYPTGLGAQDIDESAEVYAEWVWRYWLHTGDTVLLRAVYPVLVKLSGYVNRAVDSSTGLVTRLQTSEASYPYPVATRVNVLGANVFGRTADVAQVLGRPSSEVARQRARQASLVAAINQHLTRTDGVYVDGLSGGARTSRGSQEVNACALVYGVVPAHALGAVTRHVAALGLQAEPQHAAEVVRALAMAGEDARVIRVLTDSSSNGWANILARGGTFTWEVWQPSDANGDSMSHGWGSNVLVEIQQWLLGVRPTGPGFTTFDVAPPATGLASAQGTVPTPRGTIAVGWKRPAPDGPVTALDLVVPPNALATVTFAGITRAS